MAAERSKESTEGEKVVQQGLRTSAVKRFDGCLDDVDVIQQINVGNGSATTTIYLHVQDGRSCPCYFVACYTLPRNRLQPIHLDPACPTRKNNANKAFCIPTLIDQSPELVFHA